MARKHRRRTRKRNKRGGGDESVMDKMKKGFIGLDNLRKQGQQGVFDGLKGAQTSIEEVQRGYSDRVGQGGVLPKPPQPPSSPPPMDPVKKKQFSLESRYEQSPYEQSIETNQPTKEKQGGLFGLGWFGLGGRRLSHSAFINKMLRVRSKTKRNKAIRKYLKGGKKKTKKRKMKKKGRKKKGGVNDTCRLYYEKNTLELPEVQSNNVTEDEANRYCRIMDNDGCLFHTGECFTGDRTEAMEAAVESRFSRMLADSGGRRRKRKNKTKKRRRRR